MAFRFIDNPCTDPYFNLAAEEFLLRETHNDVFMLWVNRKTIVAGKHQNILNEIDGKVIREAGIRVARRLSGGGTVYHDEGNLNFTFILNGVKREKAVYFSRFTRPIIAALQGMGIPCTHNARSDILVGGKKVSGNAEHIYLQKNRVLHHGTLLFDSDLETLERALNPGGVKYGGHAVKSVRAAVCNLKPFCPPEMTMEAFRNTIWEFMKKEYPAFEFYTFSQRDREKIERLGEKKYKSWEWIWGYSPRYVFHRDLLLVKGAIPLELEVAKGVFEGIRSPAGGGRGDILSFIAQKLKGLPHRPESIEYLAGELFSRGWITAGQREKMPVEWF